MKHDAACLEPPRTAEPRGAHPGGRDGLVVLPGAFAVSGGTYQRLVPRWTSWREGSEARGGNDD